MVPKLDEIWSGAFTVKPEKAWCFTYQTISIFPCRKMLVLWNGIHALKSNYILFYNYNPMNPFKHGSKRDNLKFIENDDKER